ncbi:hypothetical protein C3747_167g34 [Trypanosoma cruzi]|uniref:Uncharacterized protein n=2 Tax=Trypanosoma cruzi TaxID=5693 RepID=Q4CTD4_TRYCC|nr:hypothetical protein, conserved [Trypanosoma cruzi]EAN83537.1 hypothetical protein, conserved [Trypanosoma cruzi]PWV03886.1 hypothetical protein C3747_167g34 [Trypanosoma cruzi]RNC47273.1 hypothetical protein TcCL_NonESM02884 [Trypanosoma cruzi]|eukprot:XP_805388.1 hypothetical protein [Trypanosoma cruzi strain CL Brener]
MERRERLLEEYKGLQANLEEALELKQSNQADYEVDALIEEIKEELRAAVASLNAMEEIEQTPGLTKTFGPDDKPVICYAESAPYEVHFDNMAWYSCVITDIVSPETSLDRIRYKVWILGYNVEEEVFSEQLRLWQPQTAEGEGALRSGVICHAIDPQSGKFRSAKVERLTLDNTVIVAFDAVADETETETAAATSAASGNVTAPFIKEVPLSHVRVGRFYEELRKRPLLTPEERAKRRAENLERKRMRMQAKRQLEADVAAQNANDWQRLVDDMGMGNGPKRRKR